MPGEVHADPTAEAIRWSICEAELIQAMGRGRGVNRTAENPLQIDLLTDVVLPVTVDELDRLVRTLPDPARPDGGARRGARERRRHGAPASRTCGRPPTPPGRIGEECDKWLL